MFKHYSSRAVRSNVYCSIYSLSTHWHPIYELFEIDLAASIETLRATLAKKNLRANVTTLFFPSNSSNFSFSCTATLRRASKWTIYRRCVLRTGYSMTPGSGVRHELWFPVTASVLHTSKLWFAVWILPRVQPAWLQRRIGIPVPAEAAIQTQNQETFDERFLWRKERFQLGASNLKVVLGALSQIVSHSGSKQSDCTLEFFRFSRKITKQQWINVVHKWKFSSPDFCDCLKYDN